jgi:hypothetical protein
MTTVIETSNGWGTPRAGGWPRTTSRQQRVRRADGQGGMWRKCDRASPPRQGSPMTGERSQVEAEERLHPAFPELHLLEFPVEVIPHHLLWNIKGLAHFWGKARNTARPGRAGNYRSHRRAS